MLSRATRIQLLAFVVIALLGITYVAVRYVGIARWLGASGYTVKADFAQGGGIFTNAEVDYRGVPVGRVGDLRLTASGIQVDLDITSGTHIPKDVEAVVADRSVIGEQYVDLRPRHHDGPYLEDGSVIAEHDTGLPPPIQDLLLSSDELFHSVPIASLRTTVDELYNATRGISTSLRQLITSSSAFFSTADTYLPQTIDLITTSKTVLATQNAQSATIEQYAANLALIGQQLKDSNGDISKVLAGTSASVTQVTDLFDQIHGSLHSLLSNLLTTSRVFLEQKNGVHEILSQLPVAITIGGTVTTSQGFNVGLVPTFFDPLPCTTGYGGTPVRSGLNTKGNPPVNTSAGCTAPISSGKDIRGSQNAPK
jgi:phospholipid/cholesterol/gamma-HCH transport system substrate-binding protein